MIKFILITSDTILARMAETAGVERIFVDLETLGKKERQGHLDTLISNHSFDDIARVRSGLDKAELIVRLNPLHVHTGREVEDAIANGADMLMLPMFRKAADVSAFTAMVDNRVGVMPLVETRGAVESLDEIVATPGVSEIYIGLNDLHLDMGLNFMFEPLADGLIDTMADTIKQAGLPFGFGGVARVGEGTIPGELVLAEHVRLGSSSVILSRTFNQGLSGQPQDSLAHEVGKLKSAYARLQARTGQQVEFDRNQLKVLVKNLVRSRVNEASV